ncbi:rRNA-binding ribosome biosynthesis protein utp25 [Puccinia graminis f. sp. tritici]|uniref:rRNA-binding ribosome biosynthesis protein utp25 n=1 Tax=Puccinia graminis f. sp. tritici TaxID=56615 RepID=A0A5B0NT83_PUCGR|nr:rRNA-binding ribosome biosynthesis protein utp25 [Puccinia graminis f. sp. tritici]
MRPRIIPSIISSSSINSPSFLRKISLRMALLGDGTFGPVDVKEVSVQVLFSKLDHAKIQPDHRPR